MYQGLFPATLSHQWLTTSVSSTLQSVGYVCKCRSKYRSCTFDMKTSPSWVSWRRMSCTQMSVIFLTEPDGRLCCEKGLPVCCIMSKVCSPESAIDTDTANRMFPWTDFNSQEGGQFTMNRSTNFCIVSNSGKIDLALERKYGLPPLQSSPLTSFFLFFLRADVLLFIYFFHSMLWVFFFETIYLIHNMYIQLCDLLFHAFGMF